LKSLLKIKNELKQMKNGRSASLHRIKFTQNVKLYASSFCQKSSLIRKIREDNGRDGRGLRFAIMSFVSQATIEKCKFWGIVGYEGSKVAETAAKCESASSI
jgi:hypothetical protein